MRKSTIVRTWIGGLVAIAGGLVVAGVSTGLMLAYGGTWTQVASDNSYSFVPSQDAFFWTMVGFIVIGGTFAAAGGLIQLVAWIGALVNTYRVPDKTWFAIVLVGGLIGFAFGLIGFAAMLAYVIGGPDGMALPAAQRPAAPAPHGLVPSA